MSTRVLKYVFVIGLFFVIAGIFAIPISMGAKDRPKYLATAIGFRHGERTPYIPLKGFSCKICEQLGYGKLTKKGSLQLFLNGGFLCEKYLEMHRGVYREQDMRILSSPSSRAVMSLVSFMSALTPGDGDLPIQPFTFDLDYDGKFLHVELEPSSCPKYFEAFEKAFLSPEISEMIAKDRDQLDNIIKEYGYPLENTIDYLNLFDSLLLFQDWNFPTPQWIADFHGQTTNYMEIFTQLLSANQEMLKFRIGMVFTEIINNFREIIDGTEGKKFLIYSGHDVTVNSLAKALGALDQIPALIGFADTITIDLIEGDSGPMVMVNYLAKGSNGELEEFPLKICNGEEKCSFSEFEKLTAHLMTTWEELDNYCQGNPRR